MTPIRQIIHVCCKAEDKKKKGWREENKQWRRHWCHFQNCCCYSQGVGWAESWMKRKRKENRRERERERWNLQNAKAIKYLQSQPPSKGPQGRSLYVRMKEPSNKGNSGILTSLCMPWSFNSHNLGTQPYPRLLLHLVASVAVNILQHLLGVATHQCQDELSSPCLLPALRLQNPHQRSIISLFVCLCPTLLVKKMVQKCHFDPRHPKR